MPACRADAMVLGLLLLLLWAGVQVLQWARSGLGKECCHGEALRQKAAHSELAMRIPGPLLLIG